MVDEEEKIMKVEGIELDTDNNDTIQALTEDQILLTTLFAVRTTINQESNILRQIFYRFRILDTIPDIKAMLVSSLLPGYIFFEAPTKRQVQIAVQGIQHIKGRIVQNIKLSDLQHVLLPRSVTEFISVGDTVEIISGVFEGSRALVMRMPHDTSSSEEVVVRLLQEETPITIKIHGDYLKLVEKKKKEIIEPVPRIQVTEGMVTELDKAISFEDDFDSEYEEELSSSSSDSEQSEEYSDDEEFDDDDEWAKFDGF